MGKVYDALRRADEQRARRAHEAQAPLASPDLPEPEPGLRGTPEWDRPESRRPGKRKRRSWFGWLRRRRVSKAERSSALNKRRIALLQPESFVVEQFRTLRARIDSVAATQPLHSIGITSALPGEGKTMAALSLAVVTSMNLGRRVLLIDCDLRRPMVHQSLGLRVNAGLAEVLLEEAALDDAIVKVEGSALEVLAVRGTPSNPSELLASAAMGELLKQLAGRYDRVILDLPPTLGLPDAKVVSELCDGLVFVVRAGTTPEADVAAAVEVLDRRRILGLVLNDSESQASRYGSRG